MKSIELLRNALILIVMMSTPILVVTTLLGVGISLVQSLFQVQDQTGSFAAKVAAIAVIFLSMGGWMGAQVLQLANNAFALMGTVGR